MLIYVVYGNELRDIPELSEHLQTPAFSRIELGWKLRHRASFRLR